MSFFIAVAIAKGVEQHWNQTDWGQQIQQTAVAVWPNGEHGSPNFAWKMTDGDSPVPNKKGNKPCDQEGMPGHWIINISSCFPYSCFHAGKYQPHEAIQNKNEIKCGDYVRVQVEIKGNESTDSPGVYINPMLLELSRAGTQIISQNAPDANDAFGTTQAVLPGNAQVDASIAAPVGNAVASVANVVSPQNVAPQNTAAAVAPVVDTVGNAVANVNANTAQTVTPSPVAPVNTVSHVAPAQTLPVIMNAGLDYQEHIDAGHSVETLINQGLAVINPNVQTAAVTPVTVVQHVEQVQRVAGASSVAAPAGNAYLATPQQ